MKTLSGLLKKFFLFLGAFMFLGMGSAWAAATLSGSVSDGTSGVSGLVVSAHNSTEYKEATTDSSGAFSISGLTGGTTYTVEVHLVAGAEYSKLERLKKLTVATDGTLTAPSTVPTGYSVSTSSVTITLTKRSLNLKGMVTSNGTTGIADVYVGIGEAVSAITGSDGTFTLPLETSGTYNVDIFPAGSSSYRPTTVKGIVVDASGNVTSVTSGGSASSNQLVVTLGTGNTLSGTIYKSDATTPAEGVEVFAFNISDQSFGYAKSGANGAYSMPLDAKSYEINIKVPDTISGQAAPTSKMTADLTSGNTTKNITLVAGAALSGKVTFNSVGVAGVVVNAFGQGASFGFGFGFTDINGNYSINLPADTYYVMAFPPMESTYIPPNMEQVKVGSSGATKNFTLTEGVTISGTVVDATSTTTGIPNVGVCAFNPTDFTSMGGFGMSDADGKFSVAVEPPTSGTSSFYALAWPAPDSVYLPPGPGNEKTITVSSDKSVTPTSTTFSLTKGFIFSGQFYHDTNSNSSMDSGEELLIPGVMIDAHDSNWTKFAFGMTNKEGKFQMAVEKDAVYKVNLWMPPGSSTYIPPKEMSVTMSDNASGKHSENIAMTEGKTISGRVYEDVGGTVGTYDSGTDTPASGVFVNAFVHINWNDQSLDWTTIDFSDFGFAQTDENGQYKMGVRGGTGALYDIECFIDPFSGVPYKQPSRNNKVDGSNGASNIDFIVEKGIKLYGTVFQPDGKTPVTTACINTWPKMISRYVGTGDPDTENGTGDGVNDDWEMVNFGNLTTATGKDDDFDGVDDGVETHFYGTTTTLENTNMSTLDTDGDGWLDMMELHEGHDPTDADDVPGFEMGGFTCVDAEDGTYAMYLDASKYEISVFLQEGFSEGGMNGGMGGGTGGMMMPPPSAASYTAPKGLEVDLTAVAAGGSKQKDIIMENAESVTITVKDSQGNVVPMAFVEAYSGTDWVDGQQTNFSGEATFALKAGDYTFKAWNTDYSSQVSTTVAVATGGTNTGTINLTTTGGFGGGGTGGGTGGGGTGGTTGGTGGTMGGGFM